MTEPTQVAEAAHAVIPGVSFWWIHDERIGGHISAAHAMESPDGTVLVDPLPLASESLNALGDVTAICLTSGSHQRSAWRYRDELGAQVYAPALSREIDEEPDVRYADGDSLAGDLTAIFTPGAGTTQHTLLLEQAGGVAFVPDMLWRPQGSELELVPAEFMHDPEEARRSVERLLDLEFSVLCLSHGFPVTEDPHAAIRKALG